MERKRTIGQRRSLPIVKDKVSGYEDKLDNSEQVMICMYELNMQEL